MLSGAQVEGRPEVVKVKKSKKEFPLLCHALFFESMLLLQTSPKMVDEAFKFSEGILPLFNMNSFHTKILPIQLGEWADVLAGL